MHILGVIFSGRALAQSTSTPDRGSEWVLVGCIYDEGDGIARWIDYLYVSGVEGG